MAHDNFRRVRLSRRMVALLVVCAVATVPAALLRILCVGAACEEKVAASSEVPFCSLEPDLRKLVANGFREERSPDVLGVARGWIQGGSRFESGRLAPPWPRVADGSPDTRVPLFFLGDGVTGTVPAGAQLDRMAPTLAAAMEIERAHPEVRSGTALPDVRFIQRPALVVVFVLKGVGSDDIETSAWAQELASMGPGTFDATTGSLPVDPAAVLTTIGTGGLPFQHGIVGTTLRNEDGRAVGAWSRDAPVSVIAALGDDLDDLTKQRAHVGLVAPSKSDRGVIGGDWYVDGDRDDVRVRAGTLLPDVRRTLARGYGDDDVPDLFAYVHEGRRAGQHVAEIARIAERASDGPVVLAVTATGSALPQPGGSTTAELVRHVEDETAPGIVEAGAPGGLFLDQDVAAEEQISDDRVLDAMESARSGSGANLLADAFSAISVTFSRYC